MEWRARTCTPRLAFVALVFCDAQADCPAGSMSTRRIDSPSWLLLSFLNAASNSAVPSTPCQAEEAPKPSISCWTLENSMQADEEAQATVVVVPPVAVVPPVVGAIPPVALVPPMADMHPWLCAPQPSGCSDTCRAAGG